MMQIYMAGPLGFSEVGKEFHEKIVQQLKLAGWGILDPWSFDPDKVRSVKDLVYGRERKGAWAKLNLEMGKANADMIDRCDLVFAVLDGPDVDSGTAAEIGYAYARSKPILGYRGDFRLSADNEGSTVNLQVEYFIRASGGTIIDEIKNLENALRVLVEGHQQ